MTGRGDGLRKWDMEDVLSDLPPRTNVNVAYVDDAYAFRIAKVTGTFPAHRHPNGDEGWFVHRGRLRIDSDLGFVELSAGQGVTVPKGIRHSPTCLEEGTLVLVINAKNFATAPDDEMELATSGFTEYDADHATGMPS